MKKLISIFIILTLVNCQSVEKFPQPEVVIPENTMVNMLIDITLLNATKYSSKKELEESGINPDEFICAKYNIDNDVFIENTKYYSSNLVKYEEIFQRVADTLQMRTTIIDSIIQKREEVIYNEASKDLEIEHAIKDPISILENKK